MSDDEKRRELRRLESDPSAEAVARAVSVLRRSGLAATVVVERGAPGQVEGPGLAYGVLIGPPVSAERAREVHAEWIASRGPYLAEEREILARLQTRAGEVGRDPYSFARQAGEMVDAVWRRWGEAEGEDFAARLARLGWAFIPVDRTILSWSPASGWSPDTILVGRPEVFRADVNLSRRFCRCGHAEDEHNDEDGIRSRCRFEVALVDRATGVCSCPRFELVETERAVETRPCRCRHPSSSHSPAGPCREGTPHFNVRCLCMNYEPDSTSRAGCPATTTNRSLPWISIHCDLEADHEGEHNGNGTRWRS